MTSESSITKKGRSFGTVITNRAPQQSSSATAFTIPSRRGRQRTTRSKPKKQPKVCLVEGEHDAFLIYASSSTPKTSNASKGRVNSKPSLLATPVNKLVHTFEYTVPNISDSNQGKQQSIIPIQPTVKDETDNAIKKRKKYVGADYLHSQKVKKMKEAAYPRSTTQRSEMPSIPEEVGETMDCASDDESLGSFSSSPAKNIALFDKNFILIPPIKSQAQLSVLRKSPNETRNPLQTSRLPPRMISPKFQKFKKSEFHELFQSPFRSNFDLPSAHGQGINELYERNVSVPKPSDMSRSQTDVGDPEEELVRLSPEASGVKALAKRMLDDARKAQADNIEVMAAMLSTNCGIDHNKNVVGTLIGGTQMQRSPSLDESEITLLTHDVVRIGAKSTQRLTTSHAYSEVCSACSSVTDKRPLLVSQILNSNERERMTVADRTAPNAKHVRHQNTPKEALYTCEDAPEQHRSANRSSRRKGIPVFIETPTFVRKHNQLHSSSELEYAQRHKGPFNHDDWSPTSITAYDVNDGRAKQSPPSPFVPNRGEPPSELATLSSQRSNQSSIRREDGSIVVKLDEPSVTFSEAPQVIYFEVRGELIPHPPLPPGWKIRLSESKNRPFYCHPDHGTTWHCPVVLPNSRGPNSRRVRTLSPNSAESSVVTSSSPASSVRISVTNIGGSEEQYGAGSKSQSSYNYSADGENESMSVDGQTASTASSTVLSSPDESFAFNNRDSVIHDMSPLRMNDPDRARIHSKAEESDAESEADQDSYVGDQIVSERSLTTNQVPVGLNPLSVETVTVYMKDRNTCGASSEVGPQREGPNRISDKAEDIDGSIEIAQPPMLGEHAKTATTVAVNNDAQDPFKSQSYDSDSTLSDNEGDLRPVTTAYFETTNHAMDHNEDQNAGHFDETISQFHRARLSYGCMCPESNSLLDIDCAAQQNYPNDPCANSLQQNARNVDDRLADEGLKHQSGAEFKTENMFVKKVFEQTLHAKHEPEIPVDNDVSPGTEPFSMGDGNVYPNHEHSPPVLNFEDRCVTSCERGESDCDQEENGGKSLGSDFLDGFGAFERTQTKATIEHDESPQKRGTDHWHLDIDNADESPMSSIGGLASYAGTNRTTTSLRVRNPPHPICALQRLHLISTTMHQTHRPLKAKDKQKQVRETGLCISESSLVDQTVQRLIF